MTEGSATVGAALRAGFSDLRESIGACWAALFAAILISVAAGYLPPGLRLLAALVAGVLVQGALFRRAFGRAPGFKGLRWGRDEWRLMGTHLLVIGLFTLIGSILLVVIGAVALGVARASAPGFDATSAEAWRAALASAGPGGLIAGLAPLAALAILVWLGLRLSLAAPATVEQSGVRVLSAFPLTKGRVFTLLLVGLAIAAPVALVGLVFGLAPAPGVGVAAATALVTYLYLAPVWAGAVVHIYRRSAASQDA